MADPQAQQKTDFSDYHVPQAGGGAAGAPEPGMLDTANQYYNQQAAPGEGVLSRMGRSLGRTAMMVPNAVSAAVSPATDEEKKQGFTSPYMQPALAAHRLVVAPVEETEAALGAHETKEAAAGHPESRGEIYANRAVGSIPVAGPALMSMGLRGRQGDVAGAVTDMGAQLALPSVIKEASPGGSLPGAAAEGRPAFPTTNAIGSRAVNTAATVAERITPRRLMEAGGAGAGGAVGSLKLPVVGTVGGSVGGGILGNRLADIVSSEPDKPIVSLPGARSFNRADMMTPKEADWLQSQPMALERLQAEQISKPLKVALPGGKTVLYSDYAKTIKAPPAATGDPSPGEPPAAVVGKPRALGKIPVHESSKPVVGTPESLAASAPDAGQDLGAKDVGAKAPAKSDIGRVGIKGESKASLEMQDMGAKGGEHEASQGQFAKVNGTGLEDAIAESEGTDYGSQRDVRDAIHKISQNNGDLARVADRLSVDIDDVPSGKWMDDGYSRTRGEIFNRMVKAGHSPQDILDAYEGLKSKGAK
jgi:hypothetical protein